MRRTALNAAASETVSVLALVAVLAWAVIRPHGWPEAVIADYPALARPGSAQVQVPDFWQPEV